jgi:hypothetical protein
MEPIEFCEFGFKGPSLIDNFACERRFDAVAKVGKPIYRHRFQVHLISSDDSDAIKQM